MPHTEHWERRFAEAIDTARAKPFAWGVHDCPTFAFQTRMILTGGEDVAALWRGRYTTALGGCQRRLNFPQKCRSKIPHSGGSGNQPVSGIGSFLLGWAATALWRRWRRDRGVGANVFGDEVRVAA